MSKGDMKLARNMRRLMAERGWSAKRMTYEADVSKSTVDYLLNGQRGATLAMLRKIRSALGCTWDELLGY